MEFKKYIICIENNGILRNNLKKDVKSERCHWKYDMSNKQHIKEFRECVMIKSASYLYIKDYPTVREHILYIV